MATAPASDGSGGVVVAGREEHGDTAASVPPAVVEAATVEELGEDLLDCARFGELEDVAALLASGADVRFADAAGNTALHKAAANGHVDVVKLLVEAGGVVTANASGNTALHWAALNGHAGVIEALCAAFPTLDVLAKNGVGRSALTEACARGHDDIARILLSHKGADAEFGKSAPAAGAGVGGDDDGPVEEETDEEVGDEDEDGPVGAGEGDTATSAGAGGATATSAAGAGPTST